MKNKWNLDAKTALVTGATKGIGKAIALEMLALGARVIITARTENDIEVLVNRWIDEGYKALGIAADVSTESGRRRIIDFAREAGGIDILVNNAGTNIRKRTMDYSPDEYRTLIDANLTSAFEMCRGAYPMLRESGDAAIINISSISGMRIVQTGAIYAAAKAGLSHLTRYLAVEWAKDGIRTNAIEPWYIETPLTRPVLENPRAMEKIIERTPQARIGRPEEIAAAAAFLAMPGASYINGQCITIDGGAAAYIF
ncbi:MAG: SDR family oxidoreductase [Candidatus Kapaibacterium sp.]